MFLASLAASAVPGEGWVGGWAPGLGDPSIIGWLTVVVYLVGAYLCLLAFKVERARRGRPVSGAAPFLEGLRWLVRGLSSERRRQAVPDVERVAALWAGFALMLLVLGINKQLDLQTLVTEIGRIAADAQGWYGSRRLVQALFIVLVLIAGWRAMRALLAFARGHIREMRFALLGTLALACFVAIRAASFHHFDLFIGTEVLGLTFNAVLEIGAIVCIAAGAARHIGVGR